MLRERFVTTTVQETRELSTYADYGKVCHEESQGCDVRW